MKEPWKWWKPPTSQPVLLTLIILVAVAMVTFTTMTAIKRWKAGIVSANLSLTELAARQLAQAGEDFFASLPDGWLDGSTLTEEDDPGSLDRRLVGLTEQAFARSQGVKGGFWVPGLDRFLGYAYPTSPPPKPVFGPPPRSYQIILDQVNESIAADQPIVQLRQFDPAIFTLATAPVHRNGEIVAVVWARVHIERELPALKLTQYLNFGAALAFFAFLAALVVTLNQRHEIRSLNEGLSIIEEDPTHRLEQRQGMFGSIREAINTMVDSLERAHEHHKDLESRLHQKDKMAALGKLLAGMAHEVKTPLAILKTRVQIWQRDLAGFSEETGLQPPLSNESMEMVLTEINRLSDLLRKLLFFSRPLDRGKMALQDPNDIIRHTVQFIRPRILQQRVDLDLDLTSEQADIIGDADSLHQVFLNILTNSLDAGGERSRLWISSSLDPDADQVVLEFRDSGPGIDPALARKVFDPFFSTRHGGTGLGLSIAYEIVQAHQGNIRFVEPETGSGAHCVITFPRAPRAKEEP